MKALERLREQAFEGNDIKKGKKSEDYESALAETLDIWFSEKSISLGQVKNYSLFMVSDQEGKTILACSKDSPFPIGLLVLDYNNNDDILNSDLAYVLPAHQGKGLGLAMYEAAFEKLGKLASSASLSGGASKVWKYLCKKYKGKLVIPAKVSPTRKSVKMDIVGFEESKGITWPIVTTDKGPLSLAVLLNGEAAAKYAAKNCYYLISK